MNTELGKLYNLFDFEPVINRNSFRIFRNGLTIEVTTDEVVNDNGETVIKGKVNTLISFNGISRHVKHFEIKDGDISEISQYIFSIILEESI